MEQMPITEVTNRENLRDADMKQQDLKSATKSVGKPTEPAMTGSATKNNENDEIGRPEETHADTEVKPVELPAEGEKKDEMEQEEVREEPVAESDTNLGKRPAHDEPSEDPETAEPALEKKVKGSTDKSEEPAAESH